MHHELFVFKKVSEYEGSVGRRWYVKVKMFFADLVAKIIYSAVLLFGSHLAELAFFFLQDDVSQRDACECRRVAS